MKFFVSDSHFGTIRQSDFPALSDFEDFCEKNLSDGDELYILGDFFDFWIEYKRFIPAKFIEVYKILLNTKNRGIKIFIVRGNHDFFRGNFFENLGFSVFDSEIEFTQNEKKIICLHGDNTSKNAKITKYVLRNGFFQFLYKILPPDFAVWLAESLSNLSRNKNKNIVKNETLKKKWQKKAFNYLDKKNCDILIMGHSHIPDLTAKNNKIYANSGAWFEVPTYVVLEKNKILLKEFRRSAEKDIILIEKEL